MNNTIEETGWKIGQYVNGITLNDLEYVLDGEDGDILYFETKDKAMTFILENGGTQEDVDNGALIIMDKTYWDTE